MGASKRGKPKKFEEAYSIYKEENILVDDLETLHRNFTEEFFENYNGQLLCPECRQARLSFKRNADSPYLYAHSKVGEADNLHDENCSKIVPMASKTDTKTYVDDGVENKKQINKKLSALIDTILMGDSLNPSNRVGSSKEELLEKSPTFEVKKPKRTVRKAFRTRRIDSLTKRDDLDGNYVMCYGKVFLTVLGTGTGDGGKYKTRDGRPYRVIKFWHITNAKQQLCVVFVSGERLLNDMKSLLDGIVDGQEYKVAFLGEIKKHGDGVSCFLKRPEFLVIK